jgi:hypothetical protein
MAEMAPERIEVVKARLGEFERELHQLLQDAADGKYDAELHARGISLPAGMSGDAIKTESITEQGVTPDQFVQLAIDYAPFIVDNLMLWADSSEGAAPDRDVPLVEPDFDMIARYPAGPMK